MPSVVGFDKSLYNYCTCANCAANVRYTAREVNTIGAVDCPNCHSYIFVGKDKSNDLLLAMSKFNGAKFDKGEVSGYPHDGFKLKY